MHLRDWFFKFTVVSGVLVIIMLIMVVSTGDNVPEGMMGDILSGVIELAKLIITS